MVKLTFEEAIATLGVEEDADEAAIKKAYKQLAMKWHPDKNPGNEDEAKQKFQTIYAAFQKLTAEEESDEEDMYDYNEEDDMEDMAFQFFMFMMQNNMFHFGGFGGSGSRRGAPRGGFRTPNMDFFSDHSAGIYVSNAGVFPSGGGYSRGAPPPRQSFRSYEEEEDYEERYEPHDADWRKQWRAEIKKHKAEHAAEQTTQKNAEFFKSAEKAEQQRREQATARLVAQLPRPVMLQRTEMSITLSLMRGGRDDVLPDGCEWELSLRAYAESTWTTLSSSRGGTRTTVSELRPGTKYIFRSRAGRKVDGEMVWGDWSVESMYATMGRAAPTAAAVPPAGATAVAGGGRKSRRAQDKPAKEGKPPRQASSELAVDQETERERMRLQKEKEAAMRKAMEKAAEDYAASSAQFAQSLPKTAAPAAGSASSSSGKKKKRKGKKAAELDPLPHAHKENTASNPNIPSDTSGQPGKQPNGTAYRSPYATSEPAPDYQEGFGGVAGAPAMARPSGRAATGRATSGGGPGGRRVTDEEMAVEEAIQLSLALEESRRHYEHEAEFRGPREELQANDDNFPAIGNPAYTAPSFGPPSAANGLEGGFYDGPQQPPATGAFKGTYTEADVIQHAYAPQQAQQAASYAADAPQVQYHPYDYQYLHGSPYDPNRSAAPAGGGGNPNGGSSGGYQPYNANGGGMYGGQYGGQRSSGKYNPMQPRTPAGAPPPALAGGGRQDSPGDGQLSNLFPHLFPSEA
ncbi:hypothetical protein WJX72_005121 [[Myrmecia] bisecta]|uniref:J domain-containing protein n=1 Tax=[Myrmecia] bisecta TaxID=41462 RepID=A0AAW1P783_9CHLO